MDNPGFSLKITFAQGAFSEQIDHICVTGRPESGPGAAIHKQWRRGGRRGGQQTEAFVGCRFGAWRPWVWSWGKSVRQTKRACEKGTGLAGPLAAQFRRRKGVTDNFVTRAPQASTKAATRTARIL